MQEQVLIYKFDKNFDKTAKYTRAPIVLIHNNNILEELREL